MAVAAAVVAAGAVAAVDSFGSDAGPRPSLQGSTGMGRPLPGPVFDQVAVVAPVDRAGPRGLGAVAGAGRPVAPDGPGVVVE